MKVLFTITLILFFFMNAGFSQDLEIAETTLSDKLNYNKSAKNTTSEFSRRYHGFIGTSWNYTIPTGDFQNITEYGTQIRFMDFGFFFTDNIGISGMWHGGSIYDRPHLNKVFYSDGILAGPILSFPLHDRVTVSARTLAGYAKNRHTSGHSRIKTSNSSTFLVSFLVRYEVVNNIGLFVDAAYYQSSSYYYLSTGQPYHQRTLTTTEITNYSVGLGIFYILPNIF